MFQTLPNVFPDLLTFSFFAPLIIRLALGTIFLFSGWQKVKNWGNFTETDVQTVRVYGIIELAGGLALILGAGTQVAALILAIATALTCVNNWQKGRLSPKELPYYVLLIIVTASLILSGAGPLAVDLPL